MEDFFQSTRSDLEVEDRLDWQLHGESQLSLDAVEEEDRSSEQQKYCSGCNKKIADRYLLAALDRFWHETCLRCAFCDRQLSTLGSRFFHRDNLSLCQRDYSSVFGQTGQANKCVACQQSVPAGDLIIKGPNRRLFHFCCFRCRECDVDNSFRVGDTAYLMGNLVFCQYHYEERRLFSSLEFDGESLAALKRSLSQEQEDKVPSATNNL